MDLLIIDNGQFPPINVQNVAAADQLIIIPLLAGLAIAGVNPVQDALEGKRELKRPRYSVRV